MFGAWVTFACVCECCSRTVLDSGDVYPSQDVYPLRDRLCIVSTHNGISEQLLIPRWADCTWISREHCPIPRKAKGISYDLRFYYGFALKMTGWASQLHG